MLFVISCEEFGLMTRIRTGWSGLGAVESAAILKFIKELTLELFCYFGIAARQV